MTQAALRDDALSSTADGFELRIGLPWIRSMPLAGMQGLTVTVDGRTFGADDLVVVLGGRRVAPAELTASTELWWYLQDRVVVAVAQRLAPGRHAVTVTFLMAVPYLPGGPDAPLVLPMRAHADLDLDHAGPAGAARDVE